MLYTERYLSYPESVPMSVKLLLVRISQERLFTTILKPLNTFNIVFFTLSFTSGKDITVDP